MELAQEKFDSIKELAEIQQNISLGQVQLIEIQKTSEAYMLARESEAIMRVSKILEDSKKSLDEISKNHRELTAYKDSLADVYSDIKVFSEDLLTLFAALNTRLRESDVLMEQKREDIETMLKDIKIQRVRLQEDRKQMDREKITMRDAKRLMVDRQAMLEREFEELKRLKEKTQ